MTFSASSAASSSGDKDLTLPAGTRCWVLSNGNAGYEVQGIGLAEMMGVKPEIKRVSPGAPGKWLAPWGPAMKDPAIAAPWPDLLIAAGRQAIPYARMIRKASGGRTFVAVLQHPHVRPSKFDFVWVPAHDRLSGPNVLSTLTSPHRITPEKLAAEAEAFDVQVAHLPRPRVCVLIGGTNKAFTLDEARMETICAGLKAVMEGGASLMVTPSRRTGEAQTAILKRELEGPRAVVWDGKSDNPYFGFMGQADAVIVTCDSVNMVGEATATGKPVHVIELPAISPIKASKFRRFLDALYAEGAARPFAGRLESWDYRPLNATKDVAREIVRRYRARQQG
ncbi:conserved protein [Tepidicaulis marinus]|uniref:Conserved protein n=1 Tax=Tepidicaulis marinus TaxID=1333998 RepID=A0A081BD62_9HYPH|nr:mitochondrial fission ELM1 family protein [Tepidicaulis marinus]GAK45980.1 conserved protein [Tepidicaulis marinus]